jgi:hypothetical protein
MSKDVSDLEKYNEHSNAAQFYLICSVPILIVLGILTYFIPCVLFVFVSVAVIATILSIIEQCKASEYSHYGY